MARSANDFIGQTYGLLTILSASVRFVGTGSKQRKRTFYLCHCACGKDHLVRHDHIITGTVRSCGCSREIYNTITCMVPGYTGTTGNSRTTEYRSWLAMLHRCYNPKVRNYHNYGGRGVTVCDRWRMSFENFIQDMGLKPGPEYSLDRKDAYGIYEKDNCKWATPTEQANNQRRYYDKVNLDGVASWKPIDNNFEI